MRGLLKTLGALFTASVLTATGWAQEAVNPKPVYLLDAGKIATDGWTNINKNNNYSAFLKADTTYGNGGPYATTTSGGNFFNTYSAPSFVFSAGTYEGLDGRTYSSVLEEMAATLGLESIPESVYSDNLVNGGTSNHILTVHGLNPEKCYVMYYIGGANKDTQAVAGFTLEQSGYLGNPVLDYVCTSGNASYATSTVTAYANVLPVTTALRAASNGYLLVRVSYVKPTAEGFLKFKLSGERANICALAIAEIDPQEAVSATVAESVNFSDVEWSPSNAKPNANVILNVSGEATLTMNKNFMVNALTVQGAGPLTIAKTDSNKLTATTTTINADTTVNAGAANLGTVTINAEKTLTVKENWANVAKNVPTTATNHGKIRFEGGSAETPIVFSMGSTNNANPGALVMAPGSVVKLTATGGNKVYKITGETGGDKAKVLLYSGQNWGMTDGSVVRNVKLIVPSTDNNDFWLSPGITDATVDLELQGRKLTGDTANGVIVLGDFVTNAEVNANGKSLSVQTGRISGTAGFNSAIAVDNSGEGTFTVARTYGAALTINGKGSVTVAEGGSLTGPVTVTGKLTYAANATPTNTITNNGTITADGEGTEVNLTGTTLLGSGTYAVKNGATLILKKAQAEAGVTVAENAKLKVKVDSYEAVTLAGVTLDGGNNVVFVLPSGEEVIGTSATMPEQKHYTYTATAGVGNNWLTKENWKLNGEAVDAAPSGTVETPVVVVLTGATTLTMDVEGVTLSALSVLGGDLTIAGEKANALTVKTVATANKVVVSGKLILDASDIEAAPTEMANVFEVAEGGTLTTKGYLNLTAENQVKSGGALEVASGVTTFNAAAQGIKGTLTNDKEATFKNGTNDALAYNTANVIVDVYGTLDMGATRWTIFANNNTINLYTGAIVQGAGQTDHGALDIWEQNSSTPAINIKKNESDTTPVQLMATVRCRDGKAVVELEEGTEATWSGNQTGISSNSGGLKVNGKGMLKLTGTNTYTGGTEIAAGATLMVNQFENLGSSGAINVLGNLKFSTTSGSVNNQNQDAWSRLTGTGTVTFEDCNSWYAIRSIATTLKVVNNNRNSNGQSGNDQAGLVVTHDATIGTLSGDGWFRSDLQSTNRTLTIVQSEDSKFSGYFKSYANSANRKLDVVVQSDNATPKTLTLSGNSIHAEGDVNTLTIDATGSVKLDGGWQGNVVANGRLAGKGSIGGTLTLANGATIDATAGALTVNGAVTLPSALTVKITEEQDLPGSVTLLNAAEATIPGGMAVTVMVGETAGENSYAVTHDAENDIVKLTVAFSDEPAEWRDGDWVTSPEPGSKTPATIVFSEGHTFAVIPEGAHFSTLIVQGAGELACSGTCTVERVALTGGSSWTLPGGLFTEGTTLIVPEAASLTLKLGGQDATFPASALTALTIDTEGDTETPVTLTLTDTVTLTGALTTQGASPLTLAGSAAALTADSLTANVSTDLAAGLVGTAFASGKVSIADSTTLTVNDAATVPLEAGAINGSNGSLCLKGATFTRTAVSATDPALILGDGTILKMDTNTDVSTTAIKKTITVTGTGKLVFSKENIIGWDANKVDISIGTIARLSDNATLEIQKAQVIHYPIELSGNASLVYDDAETRSLKFGAAGTLKVTSGTPTVSGVALGVHANSTSEATLFNVAQDATLSCAAAINTDGKYNETLMTVRKAGKGIVEFSKPITGTGGLTISEGTATFNDGANSSYTGATTVAEGAKLVLDCANSGVYNDKGVLSADVSKGAALTIDGTLEGRKGAFYRQVKGSGTISVPEDCSLDIGCESGTGIAGLATFRGTLSIGGTLGLPVWDSLQTYRVSGCNIVFTDAAGKIQGTGSNGKIEVTLSAGKFISGAGTFAKTNTNAMTVFLEAGSTLYTAGTAVTVDGTLTLPASGTVTVSVMAYGPVLKASGLSLEKFALPTEDAPGIFALVDSGATLAMVKKPTPSSQPGDSPAYAEQTLRQVADFVAAKGVYDNFSVVGKTGDNRALSSGEIDNALSCFTDLLDYDETNKQVRVDYNFGVDFITLAKLSAPTGTLAEGMYVVVCAKVERNGGEGAAADYADPTTVSLLLNDATPAGGGTLTSADDFAALGLTPKVGERWFAVPMANLDNGTNTFTVRVTNTP